MFQKVVVKDSSFSKLPRVSVRLLMVASAVIMLCQNVGCTTALPRLYEESVIKYRDIVWAKRAYNLRYGNCQRDYSQHFQNGFQAGYQATCDGGDGYVPALPPQDYRGYEYQSSDGARCVNSWFEGYPAGVAAAKNDQAGDYHDVLISRMIDSAIKQEGRKTVLPGDVPVVASKRSAEKIMPVAPPSPGDAMPIIERGTPLSMVPVQGMPQTVRPTSFQMPLQDESLQGDLLRPEGAYWDGWDSPN